MSKMNRLFEEQEKLDDKIIANLDTPLTQEQLFLNRTLAYLVELAELAQELRTFKHWSKKERSPREVCLEEYVDALHFLLSITNQYGEPVDLNEFEKDFDDRYHTISLGKNEVNVALLACNSIITEFYYVSAEDAIRGYQLLIDAWDTFLYLGGVLGFTVSEIVDAYDKKNAVNHGRQESGY